MLSVRSRARVAGNPSSLTARKLTEDYNGSTLEAKYKQSNAAWFRDAAVWLPTQCNCYQTALLKTCTEGGKLANMEQMVAEDFVARRKVTGAGICYCVVQYTSIIFVNAKRLGNKWTLKLVSSLSSEKNRCQTFGKDFVNVFEPLILP